LGLVAHASRPGSQRGRIRGPCRSVAAGGLEREYDAASAELARSPAAEPGLDVIAGVRSAGDPPTREYLARRLAEGKSKREIRRSMKRYIARQLFRHLGTVMA
jgi:hypothetical protein